MDMTEMLALMAAPIYAARMAAVLSNDGMRRAAQEEWPQVRDEMMEQSMADARQIWQLAFKGR